MPEPAVAVQNLCKTYGRGDRAITALSGVTINVAPGEIYGLLGRNGAGKTTLVKSLLDIVRPTSGDARILGISSRDFTARRAVGYLPEDHRFSEYRTGEGVLHYYAGLSGLSGLERSHRVPELLELTGLTAAADRKVRTYSKGMKQRLGLAQALVHDPQVMFLDEPTDGVDPVGRAQIREVMYKLKERGKTIFLNSHLLSEVERLCNRIGIMEKGRLQREGTVEALTNAGSSIIVSTHPKLNDETREALKEVSLSLSELDGNYVIELRSEADIDHVVDLLRARQVSIRSLSSRRMSLEEVFLEVVNG